MENHFTLSTSAVEHTKQPTASLTCIPKEPTVSLTFKHKGKAQKVDVPQSWNIKQVAPFIEHFLRIPAANQKLIVSHRIGMVKPALDAPSRPVTDLVGKSIMLIGSSAKAISNIKKANLKMAKENYWEHLALFDDEEIYRRGYEEAEQRIFKHFELRPYYENALERLDEAFQKFEERGPIPITPEQVLKNDVGNSYLRRADPDELEEGEIPEDHIPIRRFGLLTRCGSSSQERLENMIGVGVIPRFSCSCYPSEQEQICGDCTWGFIMEWRCFARFHSEMELSIAKTRLSEDPEHPIGRLAVDEITVEYRGLMREWDNQKSFGALLLHVEHMIGDLELVSEHKIDPQQSQQEVRKDMASFFLVYELLSYLDSLEDDLCDAEPSSCACGHCGYFTNDHDMEQDAEDLYEDDAYDATDEEENDILNFECLSDSYEENPFDFRHYKVNATGGNMDLESDLDNDAGDVAGEATDLESELDPDARESLLTDEMDMDVDEELPKAKELRVCSILRLDSFDEMANLEYAKAVLKDVKEDVRRNL